MSRPQNITDAQHAAIQAALHYRNLFLDWADANNVELWDFMGNLEFTVSFDLRGKTTNGRCEYYFGDYQVENAFLRFNRDTLELNREDFIKQTVPHEVAHWAVAVWQGCETTKSGKRISHGKSWRYVMEQIFGVPAKRCNTYKNQPEPVRKCRRFAYKCDCREYQLTSIRHNRIKRGVTYKCNHCGGKLKP